MARNNKTYKCILIKEKRVWNKAHDPPLNNLKLCWESLYRRDYKEMKEQEDYLYQYHAST